MPVLTPLVQQTLTSQEQLLTKDLLSMIGMFQRLEVYDELGVTDADLKTIRFAYGSWRDDITIQVRKRTSSIIPVTGLVLGTDYTVDLANGIVSLTTPMNVGDEVRAQYFFKYFSDADFDSFFRMALQEANAYKPATAFHLETAPLEWNQVFILSAYVKCLQRLLLDNGIWSRHLIWAEPEKWITYLQALYKEATEMLKFWMKQIKRRGFITVFGISSGKFFVQQQVNETNFRNFVQIGSSN